MNILNNNAIKRVHFIGIGGIGMSGLAEILLNRGYGVSGSDQLSSPITSRLVKLGAQIFLGHEAEHIQDVDAVVYSSAIHPENAEYLNAKQQGLPCIARGALLAEIMQSGSGVAIGGTHGKTTTTGLTGLLLTLAGRDPTYIIGGVLRGSDSTVRIGKGSDIVVEADESDASFLYLKPHIAVVTNIEADHLETYNWDFNCLKDTFIDFLNHAESAAIVCLDDPTLREILPSVQTRTITYGFSSSADIYAEQFQQLGLKTYFKVIRFGKPMSQPLVLNLPGLHNVLNALAVVAIAAEYQIPDDILLKTLEEFPGMGRRFHPCGEISVSEGQGKALLFNDYGHHPTEIKATIAAARLAWPNRRLVMAFQPHRYTRTQALLNDFVRVLSETDVLLLLDIYSAGELPIEGVTGETLYQAIAQNKQTISHFVPALKDLPQFLRSILKEDDIVLLQGAGNIETMVKEILI